MTRPELAAQLFCQGYNCAQAVAVAFCDVTGLTQAQAAKMASPFGGGFGRQREVCGAVSGMCMVYGMLYGYEVPNADNQLDVYADVQAMCAQFREKAGSIVCRDILKTPPLRSRTHPPYRRILCSASLRPFGSAGRQYFGGIYSKSSPCG
jgi:C_GCAxxG_C_C family probable redox protein